jgi:hypothetical protein
MYLVVPYVITLIAVFLNNNMLGKSDKENMIYYIIDKVLASIILLYAVITLSFEIMQIKERV